jgi:allantoicase
MIDFQDLIDLASEDLGGSVIWANDDFFAPRENLIKKAAPVFDPHAYTDRGKLMDGWESKRRRTPGHDTCLVRLGLPGVVRGVVVDTAFFRGNYPEYCSLEACAARSDATAEELNDPSTEWIEIVPKVALKGDTKHPFPISSPHRFTHLRFHIYPDGGVARLRVHGDVAPDWSRLGRGGAEIDVAAAENGGRVPACSDMFFGVRHNLIMPGRARNMGEGWETKRSREEGHKDWALVELAAEATLTRVEIDTNHFQGNYPDTCAIEGIRAPGATAGELAHHEGWREVLARRKVSAHTRHFYDHDLLDRGPFTHVRLLVYPDGGVSRLRVHGVVSKEAGIERRLGRMNSLVRGEAVAELLSCCGSHAWAAGMADRRPWKSLDEVFLAAHEVWSSLSPSDWLEAFKAHPRIGEKKAERSQDPRAKAWSEGEQSGLDAAAMAIKDKLAEGNRAYDAKFGHIYIVCATGKTAEEMLADLMERLGNDAEAEVKVAAGEQSKITRIRLEKMFL